MGEGWPEAACPGGYGAAGILRLASLNSWSLVHEEGGPAAAAHAATEQAGILSRVQPDRGGSVRKKDGQELHSGGYSDRAAGILRRANPSCKDQFTERARFLGSRIQQGIGLSHKQDKGCALCHVGKVEL
jgi:hypothetical protein